MNWVQGDATNIKTVEEVLKDSDAAVHAIGMLKCISAFVYEITFIYDTCSLISHMYLSSCT